MKIADFGFSRTLESNSTRSYIGTAGYLAPELRQGKDYSTPADCWALGVILYLLLSGHLPFPPEAHPIPPTEAANLVTRFAIKFPKAQWAKVSHFAKELIWALLQVNPDDRFSAADVCSHPWVLGKAPVANEPLATVEVLHNRAQRSGHILPHFHSFVVEPHQRTTNPTMRLPSPVIAPQRPQQQNPMLPLPQHHGSPPDRESTRNPARLGQGSATDEIYLARHRSGRRSKSPEIDPELSWRHRSGRRSTSPREMADPELSWP